jgi:hypothetical protein
MIRSGEDEVRAFEVIVLRFESGRGLRRGPGRISVHVRILSYSGSTIAKLGAAADEWLFH